MRPCGASLLRAHYSDKKDVCKFPRAICLKKKNMVQHNPMISKCEYFIP